MGELQEFEVVLTVTVTVEARDWAHAVGEARDYVMWSGVELDAVEPCAVDGQELVHVLLGVDSPCGEVDNAAPGLIGALNVALAGGEVSW